MNRTIARIVLSASLMLATVGLAALVLLQLPKTTSTIAFARSSPAQSIEAVRDALERAIADARLKPSIEHIATVDAAFRNYMALVSTYESEILNRINELNALMGMTGSTSGSGVSVDLQRPKSGAKTNQLRAEYDELSAKLAALRSDFGTLNVEVNKIIGSQDQGGFSAGTAVCNVLIVNGASTTSESYTTADATNTLSSLVTQNGGTVTVSDQVPASLAGFNVIYDIRFNPPLLPGTISAYLSFLQNGGKLLLVGENDSFSTRNNSVIGFVATVGGGALTYCDPGCQCAATCTDVSLCSTPNTAATFLLPAPGGTTTSGNGTPLLTVSSGCKPVSVFRPGQLTNATAGTLITFFDINTFQSAFGIGNDNLKLIGNIAAFFCKICVLACPANITVTASTCPFATGAMVSYPPPSSFGNCGVIACNPPSGFFPLGVTTVNCTASGGASCTFTVTVFNGCLEDSSPSNVALFNTQTGEYRICCGGNRFTGRGSVAVKGCYLQIRHNTADRSLLITFDGITQRGTVVLQSPPGTTRCMIMDKLTTGNSCTCQ